MSDNHRYHHHHRKDSASRFKERSLLAIEYRRKAEQWLRRILIAVAIFMLLALFYVYYLA